MLVMPAASNPLANRRGVLAGRRSAQVEADERKPLVADLQNQRPRFKRIENADARRILSGRVTPHRRADGRRDHSCRGAGFELFSMADVEAETDEVSTTSRVGTIDLIIKSALN